MKSGHISVRPSRQDATGKPRASSLATIFSGRQSVVEFGVSGPVAG